MTNVEWFAEVARRRGTTLGFHFCLMQDTWPELWEFLAFADRHDVDVVVLPVTHPMAMSLEQLRADELAAAVGVLRRQAQAGPPLGRNRAAFEREVARLSARVELLTGGEAPVSIGASAPRDDDGADAVAGAVAQAVAELEAWADQDGVHLITVGDGDLVRSVGPDPADVLGIDMRGIVGAHGRELFTALCGRFGSVARSVTLQAAPGFELREVEFEAEERPLEQATVVRALLVSFPRRHRRRLVPRGRAASGDR